MRWVVAKANACLRVKLVVWEERRRLKEGGANIRSWIVALDRGGLFATSDGRPLGEVSALRTLSMLFDAMYSHQARYWRKAVECQYRTEQIMSITTMCEYHLI